MVSFFLPKRKMSQTDSVPNFEPRTYNGIPIITNTNDNYVNATQLCSSYNELWCQYKDTKMWANIKNAFIRRYSKGGENPTPSYIIGKVYPEYQGEYIHPKLVHFVAEYCSVDYGYAFTVSDLMDSINDKVHEKRLPDTGSYNRCTKHEFNKLVKSITPGRNDVNNSSTRGDRDDPHEPDCYEREDLKRDIDEYVLIKSKLNAAEAKLNEWSRFVQRYHPEFKK